MKHSLLTGRIGKELSNEFAAKYSGIELVYDHGGSGSHTAVPYLGRKATHASTLSQVDVAVLDNRGSQKRAIVLCEIEEEGAEPKRIIGDLCNVMLAKKLRAKGTDHTLYNCVMILALKVERGGMARSKARRLLKVASGLVGNDGIQRKRLEVVCAYDPWTLEHKVKKELREAVAKILSERPDWP